MAINVTLVDAGGSDWDFQSDRAVGLGGSAPLGFGLVDGENDAVDDGFILVVNGVGVNPQAASVDLGGREINTAPVLIDGVAVSRSVLVSDVGRVARFLDAFTNTTDATITITVQTATNSGADTALQLTATTSGDTALDATDTGFVTDDANITGADSALMVAYGDGTLLPTSATVTGDTIVVTHTLTLAPGETQSLLQFATQNTTAADGNDDLSVFDNPNVFDFIPELLTGLSREEQLSIVNYSGFENIVDPFALIDSDGNRWGVDLLGKLSTLDNAALTQFLIPGFIANYDELLGTSVSEAGDEVTVVRGGIESAPGSTLTYTYTALPDEGVIRLLVAWSGGDLGVAADGVDTRLDLGANPALLVAQAFDPVFVSGVVLDDSDSGSGGTLPALTFTWGNLDPASTASLAGSQFTVDTPFIGVGAGETAYFLYYFALNDTGVGGLADLTRLNTPGPQQLTGLSAEVVANVRNFEIEEFGGRLQEVLGADGVDDILTGHRWGDSIVSGTGDDVISALGSDDIVRGGIGEDQIDGGDGADSLFGGAEDDVITGGTGNDSLEGGLDNDHLNGQTGDDFVFGGNGNDTLVGGSGEDQLFGNEDNDVLSGNGGQDTLVGGAGDDTLNGGAGADSMVGGSGSDVFIVNVAGDVVIDFSTDAGFDEVQSSVTFTIGATQSIEAVTLTGTANINATGNIFANHLVGNSGNNRLTGSGGADTLDGGSGIDTLIGGAGGDVYIIDGIAADTITELAAGTGIDEIRSSVNYTMGLQFIELITLTGTADTSANGSAAAERIVGNTGFNTLTGLGGADTLEGGDGGDELFGGTEDDRLFGGNDRDSLSGDAGADSLDGGGDDDFILGDVGADTLLGGLGADSMNGGGDSDQIFGGDGNDDMFGGAGIDTIEGGEDDDELFGGADADSLFGGAGADVLTGGSTTDTGINRLFGGDGNDTYFVTSANDRVTEGAADGGIDTVSSTISYTLTDNVETLVLEETGTNLNGTGNATGNLLTGNDNDNILDGAGGADTMVGGLGNDTYVVDRPGDVVTELNGTAEGIDTLRTVFATVLDANLENLVLLGDSRVSGTGHAGANAITGNVKANVLSGLLGNDTLTGGGGRDAFVFDTALGGTNVDHITDFAPGADRLNLDDAIFTVLTPGGVSPTKFVNGTAALDANDFLLYDAATGTLRYDADGNGAGASVVFAILDNNAALTSAAFLIF